MDRANSYLLENIMQDNAQLLAPGSTLNDTARTQRLLSETHMVPVRIASPSPPPSPKYRHSSPSLCGNKRVNACFVDWEEGNANSRRTMSRMHESVYAGRRVTGASGDEDDSDVNTSSDEEADDDAPHPGSEQRSLRQE